ncbi:MAG: endolytic transglycosylase MltG [Firmicutes bacterium]|nr:endolytic transglycosylase MltG [Bacillota bacterium]
MKKVLIVLLILVILAAGGGFFAYNYFMGSATLDSNITVEIPEGSTPDAIGTILADNGVVKSELGFKVKVKLDKVGPELKAGKYHFDAVEYSLDDVIAMLVQGPPAVGVKVTIPEGYNQAQIIDVLEEAGLVTEADFLAAATNIDFGYDYLPPVGDSLRLQGYLYPETYLFMEGDSAEGIIRMMLEQFDKTYTAEWRARVEEMGITTNEFVTMASIIEKEAVVSEDRPIISGVFYNRLETGMNLQSCATVQYALGEVKSVLSNEDVQIESPYNTYQNPGLPPGPIASPGYESLYAALYPAETEYLFFVAKPNGAHIFSNTYDEHLTAKSQIENGVYDNE